MEDSNFMHRFGHDLDAFRSVWAEGLLNFAQVFNKFYSFYEESEHGDLREHDKLKKRLSKLSLMKCV